MSSGGRLSISAIVMLEYFSSRQKLLLDCESLGPIAIDSAVFVKVLSAFHIHLVVVYLPLCLSLLCS